MYNLIKQCNSGCKVTTFTAKLVSSKSCFYHDIFFDTGTRVSRKNEKSVMVSVLIGRSTLHLLATGDVGTSWLAHRAVPRLCQQQSVCESHYEMQQSTLIVSQWSYTYSVKIYVYITITCQYQQNSPALINSQQIQKAKVIRKKLHSGKLITH